MTSKRIFAWILFLCLFATQAYSKEHTKYVISAGGGINFNSYTPDQFYGFPLYHDGNIDYGSGSGLSWSAFLEGEYKLDETLLGRKIRYVFSLGLSNFSGEFSKEAPFAYSIDDKDARLVTVERSFKANYSVILTEHSLATYLFEDVPFSLITGVGIGIPMSKSFDSQEEIVSPSDVTFGDKSKIFNPQSENIPDASGIYAALKLGARYEVAINDDFYLVPELSYNYALTKVSSSNDWKINRFAANLAISYYLPVEYDRITTNKKVPLPGIPYPERPPVAEKLEYDIDLVIADNNYSHNSKLDVYYDTYRNVDYISLPAAKIYFKNSSTDYYYPNSIQEIVQNTIAQNDAINLIVSYSSKTEKAVAEQRLEKVKEVFTSFNPDLEINSTFVIADTSKLRYQELYEELEYIEIENKTQKAFAYEVTTKELNEVEIPEFKVKSNIIVDARPYSEEFMYQLAKENGPKMYTLGGANVFSPALNDMPKEITVHGYIKDAAKREKSDNIKINLNYIRKDVSVSINNAIGGGKYFYLGFFDFDGKQFVSIDDFALTRAKAALEEGKIVRIIPLTDHLGTEEYNQNLAQSRANAAKRLINSSSDNLVVDYEYKFEINQKGPLKRQLSRSVVIIIE